MRPLASTSSINLVSTLERPAAEPIHPRRRRLVNSPFANRREQVSHVMATPPRGPRTSDDCKSRRHNPSGCRGRIPPRRLVRRSPSARRALRRTVDPKAGKLQLWRRLKRACGEAIDLPESFGGALCCGSGRSWRPPSRGSHVACPRRFYRPPGWRRRIWSNTARNAAVCSGVASLATRRIA